MIITEQNRHAWYVAVVLCALSMIFMWWLYAVSIAPSWAIFLVLAWVYGIIAISLIVVLIAWIINHFVWRTNVGASWPVIIDFWPYPVIGIVLFVFTIILIVSFLIQITFL